MTQRAKKGIKSTFLKFFFSLVQLHLFDKTLKMLIIWPPKINKCGFISSHILRSLAYHASISDGSGSQMSGLGRVRVLKFFSGSGRVLKYFFGFGSGSGLT